jgi:peptidoglycan/xylan/chitin deacetylase (PgdA/CDA1 family)
MRIVKASVWILCVFALQLLFVGCKNEAIQNCGTLFLTFDDFAVTDWYGLADSLADIDYVATYHVTRYHLMDATEKDRLFELQQRGHEIGHHSYDHTSMEAYKDRDFGDYIDEQITPLLDEMKKDGLRVSSFAYPYGIYLPQSDSLLLQHFTSVRKVAYTYTFPLYAHNVSIFPLIEPIDAVLWGAGIDNHYKVTEADLIKAIDLCSEENKGLLLLAHHLGEDNQQEWQTNLPMLIRILRYAHKKDLQFKTVSNLKVVNKFESNSQ